MKMIVNPLLKLLENKRNFDKEMKRRHKDLKPVWYQVTRLHLCLQIFHCFVISELEIN